jgi:hypothetical protein
VATWRGRERERERAVKKKTFENSHKNSNISYWNLQECERTEEEGIKNNMDGRNAETMKQKQVASHHRN